MSYENPVTPSGDKIISTGMPADMSLKMQQATRAVEHETVNEDASNNEAELETKGKNIFYHHKIVYFMFCTFAGILVTFLLGQIIMQPFLHMQWAEAFTARFNAHIQSAEGTGATTGILCNMCGILLVTINVIVRIVNRKVFKYAKKTHSTIKHQKRGG